MAANGATLAAQVSFRIGAKLSTAQIVALLNSGLSLIEAAGSFAWDTVVDNALSIPINGQWNVPNTVDIGREFSFANANNLPIVRANVGEVLWMSSNYMNVGSGIFNQWYFVGNQPVVTNPAIIQFVPTQLVMKNIKAIYHNLAPILLTAGGPTTPWLEGWLDDLVTDYAEAEAKRILDWVGWQDLHQRFVAKLADVTKIFSAQRETTGPAAEVAQALGEKATGRV